MRRMSASGSSVSAAPAGSGAGASAPHSATMLQRCSALGRACVSAPVAKSRRRHVTRRASSRRAPSSRCAAAGTCLRDVHLSAVAFLCRTPRRPQQARVPLPPPPPPQRAWRCSDARLGRAAARPTRAGTASTQRTGASQRCAAARCRRAGGPHFWATRPAPCRQTRPRLPASRCGKPELHIPTQGTEPTWSEASGCGLV
jgi:hypothetical protein